MAFVAVFLSLLPEIFFAMKIKTHSRLLLLSLLVSICSISIAQKNPYNLDIVATTMDYQQLVQEDPSQEFIEITDAAPGIVLDIRYAANNNFTGQKVYGQAKAYARKPVALALMRIQKELEKEGLGLKVYDAYRPYAATLKFYEVYPDTNYVAAPWHGSRHNRGFAVDVSLVDITNGTEVEMPTAFDDFSENAAPTSRNASAEAAKNRDKLIKIMNKYGFSVHPNEWWHYDMKGWENYKITDLSFEDLEKLKN